MNETIRLPLYVRPDLTEMFHQHVMDDYSFAEAIQEGYIKVFYGVDSDDCGVPLPIHTMVGILKSIRYNTTDQYVEFNALPNTCYIEALCELHDANVPLYATPVMWWNAKTHELISLGGFVIFAVPSDMARAHVSEDFCKFVYKTFQNEKKELEK